jgi:hypothetical protein
MGLQYEIIVKILTKLTEKRQNIHTMGRFSEKTRIKLYINYKFYISPCIYTFRISVILESRFSETRFEATETRSRTRPRQNGDFQIYEKMAQNYVQTHQ